jgi:hypothetical protein
LFFLIFSSFFLNHFIPLCYFFTYLLLLLNFFSLLLRFLCFLFISVLLFYSTCFPLSQFSSFHLSLNKMLAVRLTHLLAVNFRVTFLPGRGKMKKMMGMMMMGLAAKAAALVPLVIGKLFLLAGKAFIISKLALVLSLIIALKKLLSQKQGGGGGHHHEMHHGWQPSGGGGGGGGWDRRSLDDEDHAQRLAYSGQASTQQ